MNDKERKIPSWISIRVKPEEYTAIHGYYKATTCRKLSEYIKKLLLNKPVTVNYRNQAADEILTALHQIKKELSAIGNNVNQAVFKLHKMDTVPEIKNWLQSHHHMIQNIPVIVEETRSKMNEIYHQWLQK